MRAAPHQPRDDVFLAYQCLSEGDVNPVCWRDCLAGRHAFSLGVSGLVFRLPRPGGWLRVS